MNGISNEEGITFAELIEFVDNNRNKIPNDAIIRLCSNNDIANNILRDLVIQSDKTCIRLFNYI